jgi:hypothetical protein
VLAAVFGTPASAAELAQQQERIAQARSAAAPFSTRLILLGTAGGPTYWTNTSRRSTSSAVVVGDAIYLVDCGDGAGKRLQEALDPPSNRDMMKTLRAVFLTHLAATSMRVFGRGRRGEMEPMFAPPGQQAREPAVMNSSNPTPGTEDMTGYLYQAFATDINDRMRDNGKKDLRTLVKVEDIKLPEIVGFKSPNETPEPEMEPFKNLRGRPVRVSATLVYHAPIWPAFRSWRLTGLAEQMPEMTLIALTGRAWREIASRSRVT